MKLNLKTCFSSLIASSSLFLVIPSAHAVTLKITFTNNDLGNGNVFSPLSGIFHDGGFDNFDVGSPVFGNGIEQIAEFGDTSVINATAASYNSGAGFALATTAPSGIGPGQTVSYTVDIDPIAAQSTYFNYAAMFVSSNDAFIGNDNPQEFLIFDASGEFMDQDIDVLANTVWDAGTELNNEQIGDAAIVGVDTPPLGSPPDTESTNVRVHGGYIPAPDGEFEKRGFFFPSDPNAVVANIKIEAVTTTTTPEPSTFLGLLAVGGIGLVSKLKKKVK